MATTQGIDAPRVPLRTAIKEINTLRAEYASLYNMKDAAALTAMYLPDAVVIRGDGTTLLGRAAIGQGLTADAASWSPITLASDTMRVFGNTAWDVSTMSSQGSGGDASVTHYLMVLRRGVNEWKISSVASCLSIASRPRNRRAATVPVTVAVSLDLSATVPSFVLPAFMPALSGSPTSW